jgi:hypothetical protein
MILGCRLPTREAISVGIIAFLNSDACLRSFASHGGLGVPVGQTWSASAYDQAFSTSHSTFACSSILPAERQVLSDSLSCCAPRVVSYRCSRILPYPLKKHGAGSDGQPAERRRSMLTLLPCFRKGEDAVANSEQLPIRSIRRLPTIGSLSWVSSFLLLIRNRNAVCSELLSSRKAGSFSSLVQCRGSRAAVKPPPGPGNRRRQ